ncbi:MAG: MATE family efflux transporter [Verrucomicrobia bacterium]|nr:MATE family efflux transporter [Verrucomicrobiota bacterium]
MSEQKKRGVLKRILELALPVSLESVFQMSFNVADQIIVGLLGASAVAAVGLSNSVAAIAILLCAAIGTGSGVLIAQAYGRKDMEDVSRTAAVGQTIATSFGAIIALPLILFSKPLILALGAHPEVAELANGYFRFFVASLPLMILSTVTSAAFRSLSDSKTPMVITIASVVLNTGLGFALVLGCGPIPKLGVTGAGLATFISQFCRCAVLVAKFYRSKEGVKWHWPVPSAEVNLTSAKLIKLTFPMAISEVLWGASGFIYALVFTRLGTESLAASQIVTTIESIFIVAVSGLGPAAVASIGQKLGTGSVQAAKQHANVVLKLGLASSVVLGSLFAGVSLFVSMIFPKVGSQVLHFAFLGIVIAACFQPAKVLNGIFGNGLLATGGDTKYVLAVNLASTYAIGLPLAVFLSFFTSLGLAGAFLGKGADEVTKLVLFFFRYRTPAWYQKSLDLRAPAETNVC